MNNELIRTALFRNSMRQWELAEILRMSEANLTKILRRELPLCEQKRIVSLIEEAVKNGR